MRKKRVVGVSIVPEGDKWFKEKYVVVEPGKIMMEREPFSLPVEPPRFEPLMENSKATTDVSVDGPK